MDGKPVAGKYARVLTHQCDLLRDSPDNIIGRRALSLPEAAHVI
jgi:hypothetical protein